MIDALEKLNELGWFYVVLTVALSGGLVVGAIELGKKLKSSLGFKSIVELEREQTKKDIDELKQTVKNLDKKIDDKFTEVHNELESYKNDHHKDCLAWRGQSIDIRDHLTDSLTTMTNVLNEMKADALDEKIERMRWRILDFASQIRNGRISHPEQFNNVLHTYDDYEKLLEKHNLTNGQVDESIKFIREKYHEMLEK